MRPLAATAIVYICSELSDDQDMGSMELLAIPIKVGPPEGENGKLDRGCSKLYTKVFKVPQGGANWIGLGLHIKLPPRREMVVKTRLYFQRRGLTVCKQRNKSNKELTLLVTNNSQD